MGVRETAQDLGRKAGNTLGGAAQRGRDVAQHGREKVLGAAGGAGEGDWARRALAALPPPPVPVTEPWEVSVAALIGRHPRVPGPAVRLLHLLDGLGQVAVGPDRVGFDGEDTAWEKVQEIRLHSTRDLLPDVVVEKEVDRIREFLPPVPGRKWVVTRAVEGLLTLVLAAAEAAEREDRLLPCEIVHRGLLGRPKQLGGGLFAAAVLASVPAASASILATAKARGIPVVTVGPSGVRADRAQRLRVTSDGLRDRLRTLRAAGPEGAEGADGAPELAAELTEGPAGPGPEERQPV